MDVDERAELFWAFQRYVLDGSKMRVYRVAGHKREAGRDEIHNIALL